MTANKTDNMTVKLETPIEANGITLTELNFRKPIVGDLEEAEESGLKNMGQQRIMYALCCNVPPNDLKKLSPNDFIEVAKVMSPFFSKLLGILAK